MAKIITDPAQLPTHISPDITNQLVVQVNVRGEWMDYGSIKETADLPAVRGLLQTPAFRVADYRLTPDPTEGLIILPTWLYYGSLFCATCAASLQREEGHNAEEMYGLTREETVDMTEYRTTCSGCSIALVSLAPLAEQGWTPASHQVGLFRALTAEEVVQFRQYAFTHDPTGSAWTLCHPVCVAVWYERGFKPEVDC